MPRFSTPYYVSGRSAQRWHTNKAENAGTWAVGAAAGAAMLHHSHTRGLALDIAKSKGYGIHPQHAKAFGTALGFAAGGAGAYAGYHTYKAHKFNQSLKKKRKGVSATHG